jgi:hypothetical protein
MGLDPPYLGDREQQLQRFRSFLAERGAPVNVLVNGLRGVGKTVLLNHYSMEAESGGWLVVEREFSDADTLPAVFAQTILTDLTHLTRRLSVSVRVKRAAASLAETVLSQLGTLSLSYGEIKVGLSPRLREGAKGRFDDDLREILTQVGELCRKSEHSGFVLRYDELQVIQEKRGWLTLSALLASVAAVQQKEIPILLVLSGLPPMLENLARAKSYSERMFYLEDLKNLQPPEDRAALIDPAVRHGRRDEDGVVDSVMRDTQGYPFFIQLYGDGLWRGSTGTVISHRDFKRLRPEILRVLDGSFFESRYLRASTEERRLLKLIATHGESISIEALQQSSHRRNSQLQPVLSKLIQKGLLYRPERGRVSFTAPMFGAFLRRRAD